MTTNGSGGSSGDISLEELQALGLSGDSTAPAERAPQPPSGGGSMTQADLDRLINSRAGGDEAPAPAPIGGTGSMTQEDLDRLLNGAANETPTPAPIGGTGSMTQEDLDRLLNGAANDAPAPASIGGTGSMTQEDLDRLLNGATNDAPADQMDQLLNDRDFAPAVPSGPLRPFQPSPQDAADISMEELGQLGLLEDRDFAPAIASIPHNPAPGLSPRGAGDITPEELLALGITPKATRPPAAQPTPAAEPPRAATPPAPAPTPSPIRPAADAQPAMFQQFTSSPEGIQPVGMSEPPNLPALMDVVLDVTAQLGGANMAVADVLNMRAGTILSLDTLAEDPVELQVDGHTIARGEVVVLDERFAVKVVELGGIRR